MPEVLRSRRATAVVDAEDGGRLASLVLDGHELLGRGRPEAGQPVGWYYGSFPMVPYAGRLRNGRFRFEGTAHRLAPNAGQHAGHGLVFDRSWAVLERSADRLVAETALDARWPFGGAVQQIFALDAAGLSITLELSNDERTMPAALGFHPWFRRDLGGGRAAVSFDPARRFAPDAEGFPRLLSNDLGERPWDDVFSGLRSTPSVNWPDGPTVRILSEAPHWILYERQADAFCIEPITAPPDTLGTDRAGVVGPGRPLTLTMRLHWGASA